MSNGMPHLVTCPLAFEVVTSGSVAGVSARAFLGFDGARYVLHRLFVQRHGRFVNGLDTADDAWNSSSSTGIFKEHTFKHHTGDNVYGLFEEELMSDSSEHEFMSVFLVFCNRFVAYVFAVYKVASEGACQYEAFRYTSFHVQMLGKSFRMMRVMVWGMIVPGTSN